MERELREHGGGLAFLPRILCLSKADLVPEQRAVEAVEEWRERLGESVQDVLVTSAATGTALRELAAAIFRDVPPDAPVEEGREAVAVHRVYRPGEGEAFHVERAGPGSFRVAGGRVERLVGRHDVDNEEALRYLEERLRAMGVIRALQAAGFEAGDDVEIAGTIFELDPGAPFR